MLCYNQILGYKCFLCLHYCDFYPYFISLLRFEPVNVRFYLIINDWCFIILDFTNGNIKFRAPLLCRKWRVLERAWTRLTPACSPPVKEWESWLLSLILNLSKSKRPLHVFIECRDSIKISKKFDPTPLISLSCRVDVLNLSLFNPLRWMVSLR